MAVVQLAFALVSYTVFLDHEEAEFLSPALSLLAISALLFVSGARLDTARIGFRDALVFAVATWCVAGFAGAVPIIQITGVSITDGVFESISALTTTGATVLSGLDALPKTFLLYRQFLQWLGGLGIVIFVVAVLPMLNVGGMRLLRMETPGPMKDDKVSPRIAKTAHHLWLVYVVLTLLCALSYYLVGMSPFDAVAHSFSTVSTGGFSTHDASLGYFNSHLVLFVSNIFMLAGAINFALHFRVWKTHKLHRYWRDEEFRIFLFVVFVLSMLITVGLVRENHYTDATEAASYALFHLVSFITSTGFGASDFTDWPLSVVFLLFVAGYIGGCAGSTAGGNKIVRNILTMKVLGREIKRLIHPSGTFIVKYQGKSVDDDVVSATISFMCFAAFFSVFISLLLMATGLDFWSSLSAVAACLNVLGPAFGKLSSNFQAVSDVGTWLLSATMVLGRLEYFTVLALFSRYFWRH